MPERHLGQNLGKYRVDSLIGSGGFAWVFKAWDPELEIPVALKVLKPQYAGDETFESRFRREASTAARLRHPNIVKIFAVGKENGAVYFAMDYLPQNLTDRLEVMTTLPEPVLMRMGIDVASALGFAHREGVIHRDIKVDNILFDDHGNAVVADFGIARAVSNYVEQTGTNMVVGTPQYFSPEQARGQPLDGRADIYSLGVTLYRAATGSLPFNGDDWYEIARQHVEERPPKPRTLNPALSRDLESVILRCLEKAPEDRFATAEELCHALAGMPGDVASTGGRTLVLPALLTSGGGTVLLPALQRRERRTRTLLVGGLTAAGVLLLAAPLLSVQGRGDTAPPSADSRAPSPGLSRSAATPEGAAAGAGAGQLGADGRDAAAPPVVPPSLTVRFPRGATLRLDDSLVSTSGTWRSGPLDAGAYRLVAVLADSAACPSARQERVVELGPSDTGARPIRLSPRPCGWLRLAVRNRPLPPGVTFTVRPAKGGPEITGRLLPPADSVALPEGDYELAIEAPACASYSSKVGVRAQAVTRVSAAMICGAGKE